MSIDRSNCSAYFKIKQVEPGMLSTITKSAPRTPSTDPLADNPRVV